jgi:hypothetical protein
VGIAVALVLLALGIASAFARYVSETSLIDMVDTYEESGQRRRVGEGLRAGWSRRAWRLFLIDLLVGVPTALAMLLMFALAGAPALLWLTGSELAGGIGTAMAVLLFIPAVLVAIAVGVCLSVLFHFFRRACVIEGLGVRASIRRGWQVARRSLSNVTLTWLIMLGIGIGWSIARFILFFVLLPVFVVTVLLGIVAGGIPTLIALGVASLASQAPPHWVPYLATAAVGISIGVPLFVLIAGAPWFLLNGLMQVFSSSVWTQVYRGLRDEGLSEAPALVPADAVPGPSEEQAT